MKKLLVTGSAGFIGFSLSLHLLKQGYDVVGLDSLNDYYDVTLKHARLKQLEEFENFKFKKVNLADKENLFELFEKNDFDTVINLAAQAGVRYSIENPYAYIEANLCGFANILEACKQFEIKHLLYASSSSVYGSNETLPFSTNDSVDHPLSLYAATKKSNELMAHSYSHLFKLPTTGLRFFTAFGPWGRPDMALFKFTKAIIEDKTIQIFNHGKHNRDFTYIDDIVSSIAQLIDKIPESNPNWDAKSPTPATSHAPWRVLNIGNSEPVELNYFIETLEKKLNKQAKKEYLPLQPGDVPDTHADVSDLHDLIKTVPSTPIEVGIERFVEWYKSYYQCEALA